jgi:threonine/homoserine/homoserine lactone efflux protein
MPIETLTLLAFIPAALALNLTPGADMMFCLGQGLRGGPRAALAADFGIAVGGMVHVTLAGLGLGALVSAAPWVFEVVRWVGVAYLLWLAAKTLRNPFGETQSTDISPRRAFRDALIVNLTNPKVILFVLAFIPQFVDPEGPVLIQFLIFGAILSVGGLVVNGAVGVFAGSLGQLLIGSRGFERGVRVISASIFGALAVRLALMQRS